MSCSHLQQGRSAIDRESGITCKSRSLSEFEDFQVSFLPSAVNKSHQLNFKVIIDSAGSAASLEGCANSQLDDNSRFWHTPRRLR